MKECPKCHKIYNDNINFCIDDGSELIEQVLQEDSVEEEQENTSTAEVSEERDETHEHISLGRRLLNFLKSRVFRWSLLATVAVVSLIHGGYLIFTYTDISITWLCFIAVLSLIVGLTLLFAHNNKVRMTILAIAAAMAIGAGIYTINYFNSATYLNVTPLRAVFYSDDNTNINIYVDCDRPWIIVHHPNWTKVYKNGNFSINVECDSYYMATGTITIKSGNLVRHIDVVGIERKKNVSPKLKVKTR